MKLGLFLVVFSTLGMNLFGTSNFNQGSALGVQANFQTFGRSFIAPFWAATGEAWDQIMHDLSITQQYWFDSGHWCAPQGLFRPQDEKDWLILQDKCLIAEPDACPSSRNPLSAVCWIAFTILINFMNLNLLVAVILKAYDEGKKSTQTDNIDVCIEVWKRYDPDRRMSISLPKALQYLNEVISILRDRGEKEGKPLRDFKIPLLTGNSVSEISRTVSFKQIKQFAKVAVELRVTDDGQVTFVSAARQVLRPMSMQHFEEREAGNLSNVVSAMNHEDRGKLLRFERRSSHLADEATRRTMVEAIAVTKIQEHFRLHLRGKDVLVVI